MDDLGMMDGALVIGRGEILSHYRLFPRNPPSTLYNCIGSQFPCLPTQGIPARRMECLEV